MDIKTDVLRSSVLSSASLMLALQRWGEFLELASFLWIFFVWGRILWGGPFSWGRENGGGGVGDIYII